MPKYTVLKAIALGDQPGHAGATVELSERQAKYLLLAGKIATINDARSARKKEN